MTCSGAADRDPRSACAGVSHLRSVMPTPAAAITLPSAPATNCVATATTPMDSGNSAEVSSFDESAPLASKHLRHDRRDTDGRHERIADFPYMLKAARFARRGRLRAAASGRRQERSGSRSYACSAVNPLASLGAGTASLDSRLRLR